jgi:hypothetical protein
LLSIPKGTASTELCYEFYRAGRSPIRDTGMKSYLFKAKHNWAGLCLAFAGFAALIAANDPAGAAKVRNEQFVESRPADEPLMAIISLHDRQITIGRTDGSAAFVFAA